MPTNQFVPVATGSGANVRTYSQWAGTAVQVTGVQTGIVAAKDMNTAWRQGTTMASVLGQLIVNRVGIDATDDGNVPGLLANVERGIAAMIDPSRYAEDSGAVNTLVASLSPAPVALTPFLSIRVRVQFTNTSTTPTLNINGFGPLTIVRQDGSPVTAGDLQANRIINFVYDRVANTWRIGGPAASDIIGTTYITTAIIKTIGATGADFTNLQAAFNWVSNYRITQSGSVVLQFLGTTNQTVATQYVSSTSVYFYHPDGNRITVKGATLLKSQPVGSALAFTGNSASARAADTATNLATLRTVYATELVFQGSSLQGQGNINFQDLLITGDNTGPAPVDGIFWTLGFVSVLRCAVVGFKTRGFIGAFSYFTFNGTNYALGNGSNGFSAEAGSVFNVVSGTQVAMSNALHGFAVFGSRLGSSPQGQSIVYARGNGADGFHAEGGRIETNADAVGRDNAGAGFIAPVSGSSIAAIGTTSLNNGTYGYGANLGGYVQADNTSGSGNGMFGYWAFNGSTIYRNGGTCTGNTAASSPAVGSVGNNNSIVI